MKKKCIILNIILLSIIIFSCKKTEDESESSSKWLFTINFEDDFIHPQLKAIVFISDQNGYPVADTMVSGNLRLVLNSKMDYHPPFHVSIVTWEPDMHNFRVTIQTYLYITPAEWTLKGHRNNSSGNAIVNLTNIPVHSGPILYSNGGHSNLTFATTGSIHPIYQSPDDLYILLTTPSGPYYKWHSGLVANETYAVDLSSMEPTLRSPITFPVSVQDFHMKMFWNNDSGGHQNLPILTDEQIGDGKMTDSVLVSYPPSLNGTFLTTIEMTESWTSASKYIYRKNGTIPMQFIMTDASVGNVRSETGRIDFNSSGSFTVCSAIWYFQDTENLAFDWSVYGPDSLSTISLPLLPPAMTSMFPTLAHDSLQFHHFELMQYPGSESYAGFLEKLFNTVNSGRIENFEASGVRIEP